MVTAVKGVSWPGRGVPEIAVLYAATNKRLEDRSGGPFRHSMIQLACAVVAPAHQCQYLTGVWIESDQRHLRILIGLTELPLPRVKFIHLLIHDGHAGINGRRSRPLQVWDERRIDVKSCGKVGFTELLDKLIAHQVDKIECLACVHTASHEMQRVIFGTLCLVLVDGAGLDHGIQDYMRRSMVRSDRTIDRRNIVLDSMVETGAINKDQAERAKDEPLHLVAGSVDASEAPYFVDLVRDQLIQKLGETDFNREGLHIYTSLDPDLQRAASEAVDAGMVIVDEQVDKLHARQKSSANRTNTRRWRSSLSIHTPVRYWHWWAGEITAQAS